MYLAEMCKDYTKIFESVQQQGIRELRETPPPKEKYNLHDITLTLITVA
jgi:hypothetical protein